MGTPAASSVRRTSAPTWGPFSTVSSTVVWSTMGSLSEMWATSVAARVAVSLSLNEMLTTDVPSLAFNAAGVPSAMTRPWSTTMMFRARRSASSRYWVVSSTVVPRATRFSITPQRSCLLWGSSPVVGSSRKRTGGRATSAAARSRRRRMPPE